jgi:hypothetical protein
MINQLRSLATERLRRSPVLLSLVSSTAAFITYFSMYAFRKPFTAAEYEGMTQWGVDFKILLIVSQVIGYTLSKFIGIRLVSGISAQYRITYILACLGISWLGLLSFALLPPSLKAGAIFLNGLPLGLIWGLVFAFLEGRRQTELLAAGLASSFIISSGVVKSVGLGLILHGVEAFWMPFLTALIFMPTLLLGTWMLSLIPEPSRQDKISRSERPPMSQKDRRSFFLKFAPGIVLVTLIYMSLNAYRDFRDNFAVELWNALGYGNQVNILAWTELPIALSVLMLTAALIFIRNNRIAFYLNYAIILAGGLILMLTTYLFQKGIMSPILWMISVGFGMYAAYIAYHAVLFERWIALFREKGNIGFLMYIADAFGYLASVGVLMFRNFGYNQMSWLNFFTSISYLAGSLCLALGGLAVLYFKVREKQLFRYGATSQPDKVYASAQSQPPR